jgi:hypothetical protein
VARTNTQPLGESFDPAFFQTTFSYQAQAAGNCARSSEPRRTPRRTLRPAPHTRTKARLCCRSCGREVTHILIGYGGHGTTRPAIDFCTQDADEEPPIKAHITRDSCPPESFPINIHGQSSDPEKRNCFLES